MSVEGHDEGTSMDQAGPGGRVRGSFDRERQGRSVYLVGVLARAMAAQVDDLARVSGPAPDGWWFAEPDAPARNGSDNGDTSVREEDR